MLTVLLASIASTVLAAPLPNRADDKGPILGDWKVVAMRIDGVEQEGEAIQDMRLTITATTAKFYGGQYPEVKYQVKTDEDHSPRRIDLTINNTIEGIFKTEGKTMFLLLGRKASIARPRSFDQQQEGFVFYLLQKD